MSAPLPHPPRERPRGSCGQARSGRRSWEHKATGANDTPQLSRCTRGPRLQAGRLRVWAAVGQEEPKQKRLRWLPGPLPPPFSEGPGSDVAPGVAKEVLEHKSTSKRTQRLFPPKLPSEHMP